MVTTDSIIASICQHLAPFNTRNVTLVADTDIASELDIDSMATMEMVFALEETYDVSIPLNRLADTRTIGQLAALVSSLKAAA